MHSWFSMEISLFTRGRYYSGFCLSSTFSSLLAFDFWFFERYKNPRIWARLLYFFWSTGRMSRRHHLHRSCRYLPSYRQKSEVTDPSRERSRPDPWSRDYHSAPAQARGYRSVSHPRIYEDLYYRHHRPWSLLRSHHSVTRVLEVLRQSRSWSMDFLILIHRWWYVTSRGVEALGDV